MSIGVIANRLVVLAAMLSVVAFAAPRGMDSEVDNTEISTVPEEHSSVHTNPKVAFLKEQFNQLQTQMKSGEEITPGLARTVAKMVEIISKEVEPAIIEQHESDQEQLNLLMDSIGSHNKRTTEYTNQLQKEAADLRTKIKEHNSMSMQWKKQGEVYNAHIPVYESKYLNRSKVCCHREQAAVKELVHTKPSYSCDFTKPDADSCIQRADVDIRSKTEQLFAKGQAYYDLWHSSCNKEKSDQALHSKKNNKLDIRCDELQAEVIGRKLYIDNERTRFMAEWTKTTTQYAPIYKKRRYAYTAEEVVQWNREATRKDEWNSVELIKCLLSGYAAGGKFTKKDIVKCNKDISTYHLNLVYPKWVCMLDYKPVLADFPSVTVTKTWSHLCQATPKLSNAPFETCKIPEDKIAPVCSNHIAQSNPSGEMTEAQQLALHQ
eukprot:TRINITY_DN334_c0_g1_i3.p1 TRINITY_DN334_c0_g1~~TRINITY_DN334_c0_g1_i3.p1  ORF type:complete len:434 (+),score=158.64 TRINITY_DN334_c0_g1_i3:209-1510(+)